jgi:hypothetical protein
MTDTDLIREAEQRARECPRHSKGDHAADVLALISELRRSYALVTKLAEALDDAAQEEYFREQAEERVGQLRVTDTDLIRDFAQAIAEEDDSAVWDLAPVILAALREASEHDPLDDDALSEVFDRVFIHVPLALYDEHLKPAEWALSQLRAERDALGAALRETEDDLRREWWLNHGHDLPSLYGDDGEMQCSVCFADFKRQPLVELREVVRNGRLARARAALAAGTRMVRRD